LVKGVVVMKERLLLTVDEDRIIELGQASAESFMRRREAFVQSRELSLDGAFPQYAD
jgi:hypothetical protein